MSSSSQPETDGSRRRDGTGLTLASALSARPGTSGSRWTRRAFVRNAGHLAAASSLLPPIASPAVAAVVHAGAGDTRPRYRAVSWWLTFDDLTWPNAELMDRIRRRADRCAASGVNCCIIFGAHFRWDFMPLWGRLHDLIRFIAAELHERKIVLFDHHSSVLTHRPRNRDEALNIWQRNRHHVPFYPSNEAAATWEFNGSRLNDWRMLDVETGHPVYLSAYDAEQFCMNHPALQDAYREYVRRLLTETGIDGLMSDDGIFYADWRACGCAHCRNRFRREYGHDLPPVSDPGFWGNRRSGAFRDWIEMRFKSSRDFLTNVQQVLPAGFPLLTCCSSSDGHALPAFGMSYQDFIQSSNHVLLEMVGSTPSIAGTWDNRIPSQLLHLGIARQHRAPCFGLGYGYFPDTAFFVWALNKFLGSDTWFSTLKGRLGATPAQLEPLADDADLVGEGFRWEQAHPRLFTGEVDTDLAVFFSRDTRDFHGQVAGDYVSDFQAGCLQLMRANLSYEVVTEIPAGGPGRQLVLSSAVCLSAVQRQALARYLENGGTVIATGPTGHCDERANPLAKPWLHDFGFAIEMTAPVRPGGFPPYKHFKEPVEIAQCLVPGSVQGQLQDGWLSVTVGRGRLLWRPERISQKGVAAAVIRAIQIPAGSKMVLRGLPAEWRVRQYRDGTRQLIHALPARVQTVLHPTLQNQVSRQPIIESLRFEPLAGELVAQPNPPVDRVLLHSPDLPDARVARRVEGKPWTVELSGISRYFIVECIG